MLSLNNLSPQKGSRKNKKRKGRGPGTGLGKTAGRGHKGARSRSGYSAKPGFEGGQMPLHRRLPKRGFTNIFSSKSKIITLTDLNQFEADSLVDRDSLLERGLIQKTDQHIKILANGTIDKALTIDVDKVSSGAKKKIITAGGTIKE